MKIRLSCSAEENLELSKLFIEEGSISAHFGIKSQFLTFSVTNYRSRGAKIGYILGIVVHRTYCVKIGILTYNISKFMYKVDNVFYFNHIFEDKMFGSIKSAIDGKVRWVASLRVAHIRLTSTNFCT